MKKKIDFLIYLHIGMLWYQAMQLKQWGLTGIVPFDLLTKEPADADVDRLLLQLFNLAGNNYYIHHFSVKLLTHSNAQQPCARAEIWPRMNRPPM